MEDEWFQPNTDIAAGLPVLDSDQAVEDVDEGLRKREGRVFSIETQQDDKVLKLTSNNHTCATLSLTR